MDQNKLVKGIHNEGNAEQLDSGPADYNKTSKHKIAHYVVIIFKREKTHQNKVVVLL